MSYKDYDYDYVERRLRRDSVTDPAFDKPDPFMATSREDAASEYRSKMLDALKTQERQAKRIRELESEVARLKVSLAGRSQQTAAPTQGDVFCPEDFLSGGRGNGTFRLGGD